MATVTLTFTLPDEQVEADLAMRAGEYRSVLDDIVSEARRRVKYEGAGEELGAFYAWMWGALKERNIDPFSG